MVWAAMRANFSSGRAPSLIFMQDNDTTHWGIQINKGFLQGRRKCSSDFSYRARLKFHWTFIGQMDHAIRSQERQPVNTDWLWTLLRFAKKFVIWHELPGSQAWGQHKKKISYHRKFFFFFVLTSYTSRSESSQYKQLRVRIYLLFHDLFSKQIHLWDKLVAMTLFLCNISLLEISGVFFHNNMIPDNNFVFMYQSFRLPIEWCSHGWCICAHFDMSNTQNMAQ